MNLAMRLILAAAVAAGVLGAGAPRAADEPDQAPRAGEPFRATMNRVFGPGGWRQTSAYRTPAQEAELRRRGAGAVPAGRTSSHSLGRPGAPAAYDAVVPGMAQAEAAARLRRAAAFPRVLAERAHGPEGPHLHIEVRPGAGGGRAASAAHARSLCDGYRGEDITLRVVNGRMNPLIACERAWAEARAKAAAAPGRGGGRP
jgi:hypothetical protein